MAEHEWVFDDCPFSQRGYTEIEIPVYCRICGEESDCYISISTVNLNDDDDDCKVCTSCGTGEIDDYVLQCEACDEYICDPCLRWDGETDSYLCEWCI